MEATGGLANNNAGLKCDIQGQRCEFNVTGGAWQNAVYRITFPLMDAKTTQESLINQIQLLRRQLQLEK